MKKIQTFRQAVHIEFSYSPFFTTRCNHRCKSHDVRFVHSRSRMLNVSRNERSNRLIYQITIDLHELFSNRAWLNIRRSRGVSILRLEDHFSSSQRRLSFGFSIDRCIARKRRVNGFRSIRGCRFVSSFVILIDRLEEERNREFF